MSLQNQNKLVRGGVISVLADTLAAHTFGQLKLVWDILQENAETG